MSDVPAYGLDPGDEAALDQAAAALAETWAAAGVDADSPDVEAVVRVVYRPVIEIIDTLVEVPGDLFTPDVAERDAHINRILEATAGIVSYSNVLSHMMGLKHE